MKQCVCKGTEVTISTSVGSNPGEQCCFQKLDCDIKFSKIRDVKSPSKGTTYSAGIDFFVPEYNEDFIRDFYIKNPNYDYPIDRYSITVDPHSSILIPSGIRVNMNPPNFELVAFNKSGICVKQSLIVGACIIDSDYMGEMHIHLINTSDIPRFVDYGQKIIQCVLLPLYNIALTEVEDKNLYEVETERGAGGFGSTGIV
jgi:dUTP pyrophosphatase